MKIAAEAAAKRRGAERRADILAGAYAIFIERGYAGTTTDAIVERCGGSKETVYAHFGSKLGLFRAIVLDRVERLFGSPGDLDRGAPDAMLRTLGRSFVRGLGPDTLLLARVVVAERDRIADIAAQIQELGIDRLARAVAAALAKHQARGTLGPGDTFVLARTFLDLLTAQTLVRPLFDPTFEPTAAERDAHVDLCVDIAMRLMTPTPGRSPFGSG